MVSVVVVVVVRVVSARFCVGTVHILWRNVNCCSILKKPTGNRNVIYFHYSNQS